MRQLISAFIAVVGFAVAGTAPAAACGAGACSPCASGYYASPCAPPAYTYQPAYGYPHHAGCGHCGAAYERLPEPTTQYYYVNQGPTYTGPGNFAPYPAYRETALPVWGYRHHAHGYGYGYRGHHHPRRAHGYRGHGYRSYTWGQSPYYHGRRVLRRYY